MSKDTDDLSNAELLDMIGPVRLVCCEPFCEVMITFREKRCKQHRDQRKPLLRRVRAAQRRGLDIEQFKKSRMVKKLEENS